MATGIRSILLLTILRFINCHSVYEKLFQVKGLNVRSHLQFPHIRKICANRDFCKLNFTRICSLRHFNGRYEYKDFENSCFLFMANMCDYPGDEYNIVQGTSCKTYLREKNQRKSDILTNATHIANTSTENWTGGPFAPKPPLRSFSPLYELDESFDGHICPLDCPDVYSPHCFYANRGIGKYFKFFMFVNHCQGDIYYCKHFEEFAPPDGVSAEQAESSALGWSNCAAYRYMQFSRFSEVLSSLNHYGWLEGDGRYSAILPPEARRPGYG